MSRRSYSPGSNITDKNYCLFRWMYHLLLSVWIPFIFFHFNFLDILDSHWAWSFCILSTLIYSPLFCGVPAIVIIMFPFQICFLVIFCFSVITTDVSIQKQLTFLVSYPFTLWIFISHWIKGLIFALVIVSGSYSAFKKTFLLKRHLNWQRLLFYFYFAVWKIRAFITTFITTHTTQRVYKMLQCHF